MFFYIELFILQFAIFNLQYFFSSFPFAPILLSLCPMPYALCAVSPFASRLATCGTFNSCRGHRQLEKP